MLSACRMDNVLKQEENVQSHFCVPVSQITCFFHLEEQIHDLKKIGLLYVYQFELSSKAKVFSFIVS
jgi:hypothetical protein